MRNEHQSGFEITSRMGSCRDDPRKVTDCGERVMGTLTSKLRESLCRPSERTLPDKISMVGNRGPSVTALLPLALYSSA